MFPKNVRERIFIIVPAYNEERYIGFILKSLLDAGSYGNFSLNLVLVNHRSEDKTVEVGLRYKNGFDSFKVIEENSKLRCGGQPRNTGFKYVLNLLDSELGNSKDNAIISTVDADVFVHKMFFQEIVSAINRNFELVSFCERNNPTELIKWVNSQKSRKSSLMLIVGSAWIRFQVVWSLTLSGIKETRGSGGYAMHVQTFKKIGHFQPFDDEGNPVTGENNRFGIVANRMGINHYVSPFVSLASIRREIFFLGKKDENKGYKLNNNKSEVFSLAREEFPGELDLDKNNDEYLKMVLRRMIRMILIRGIAFNKLENLYWLWDLPVWAEIIGLAESFIKLRSIKQRDLEIIGHGIYNEMFDYVSKNLPRRELDSFFEYLVSLIPDSRYLDQWINQSKEIILPDNFLIKGLREKFLQTYSNYMKCSDH